MAICVGNNTVIWILYVLSFYVKITFYLMNSVFSKEAIAMFPAAHGQ